MHYIRIITVPRVYISFLFLDLTSIQLIRCATEGQDDNDGKDQEKKGGDPRKPWYKVMLSLRCENWDLRLDERSPRDSSSRRRVR